MQDPDKDASETVIEGEATLHSRKKKASGDKSNNTNQLGSSPGRILFSLRNLMGFLVFALAAIGGSYWLLNNVLPPSKDSLKLSTTINEVTERASKTQLQLAELKDQVDKLETKFGSLEGYIEAKTQDVSPDKLLVRLNVLEAQFEDLSNEITRTQIGSQKPLEELVFGTRPIKHFLDSLWLDSQTGKSLTIYLQLIDTLKSNSIEDKSSELLLSVERVLNGNLSSHVSLLNELKQKILQGAHDSAVYDKTPKPIDKLNTKINRDIRTNLKEDTSKLSTPSLTQYFASLFKLRKLPHDNDIKSDRDGRHQFFRDEAAQKSLLSGAYQTIQRANKIPEKLSDATMYLKEVLYSDSSNISSQQLSRLKTLLSQIESRQQVDKMINKIYQSNGLLTKRVKP